MADRGALAPAAEVAGVPFYPQQDAFCGPASLAMVLNWAGDPIHADALVPLVYAPGREGTLQTDLVAGARRRGRLAIPIGDLRALLTEVQAGRPVLVLQNLGLSWAPQWHYAVAVGFDLERERLLLRSGDAPRLWVELSRFEHTWARSEHWGLLVLPPGVVPDTADELAYVAGAAGLERAGHPAGAAAAYEAALARWPSSLAARIGLGNARYRLGALEAAEAAFRRAVADHPEAGAALNNLAHVLAERGRLDEAEGFARRASALGGEAAAAAAETLAEIAARR